MKNIRWVIDPAHSEIGFRRKHMMFTTVSGKIQNFTALIATNVDLFENATVVFDGNINSSTTENAEKDAYLFGQEFSGASCFPEITFIASAFQQIDEVNYKLTGDLKMKDITRTIVLDTEFSGLLKDPFGNIKSGFMMTAKINRKEWGLSSDEALKTGSFLITDDLRLTMDIQFIRLN